MEVYKMENVISRDAYAEAGVDAAKEEVALERMLTWITKTFAFRQQIGSVQMDIGQFANVIDIGHGMGLALSTDGVGTKLLVAQMMDKYDTVGIDCVAMNVNDVICVGAEPIALLDYIAIEEADPDFLEAIAKGLYKGAEIAGVTIPGGEVAQVGEMIRGKRENRAFDLVGTCIGILQLDKKIIGENLEEGDVLIGLTSSGIHSNGLSLARKVFFTDSGLTCDKRITALDRTVGEELLEPTRIYVREIMEMLNSNINLKALINITGGGLLNLLRVASPVGFVINNLPEPLPIFNAIQEYGSISDGEMYTVFNMGIGFCVVVPKADVPKVFEITQKHNLESCEMGYVVKDAEKTILLESKGLLGNESGFSKS